MIGRPDLGFFGGVKVKPEVSFLAERVRIWSNSILHLRCLLSILRNVLTTLSSNKEFLRFFGFLSFDGGRVVFDLICGIVVFHDGVFVLDFFDWLDLQYLAAQV